MTARPATTNCAAPRDAYRYRACGLTLASNVPFPELVRITRSATAKTPDLSVQVGAAPRPRRPFRSLYSIRHENGTKWLSCARTADGFRIRFHGLADFWVGANGDAIRCEQDRNSDPATLRHLILDQVIPYILNLRGQEAIHATSILLPEGACAFLGAAGTGKSTLAASFSLAGYPVFSDDCLVLEGSRKGVLAVPGYPGIRLWDDAIGALGATAAKTQPVSAYSPKRRIVVGEQQASFPRARQRLTRIDVLDPAGSGTSCAPIPIVQSIPARDAFMALIESAYRLDISDRAMLTRQFRFIERVISEVPVRRLCHPRAFSQLRAVRECILEDVGRRDSGHPLERPGAEPGSPRLETEAR